MFSRRRILGYNFHWDRDFISTLRQDLGNGGYSDISVKLPFNPQQIIENLKDVSTSSQLKDALKPEEIETEISFDEFLKKERNFVACIFIAKNPATNETVKVLFVNRSIKATFLDDTFPSVQSSPSEIYVQSPDPARIYPLLDFLYSHLLVGAESAATSNLKGLVAWIVFVVELMTFFISRRGTLQAFWGFSYYYDIILFLLALWVVYNFQTTPIGLSVNNRETQTLNSYVRRIIVGDYKDNPIVVIVLAVVATIISNIIVGLLGLR